jgi:hypothetical protein
MDTLTIRDPEGSPAHKSAAAAAKNAASPTVAPLLESGIAAFPEALGVVEDVDEVGVDVGVLDVVLVVVVGDSGAAPFSDMTLSRTWIRPLLVLHPELAIAFPFPGPRGGNAALHLQDVRTDDLGVVEVDVALDDPDTDGQVGEGGEDLAVLEEIGVGDLGKGVEASGCQRAAVAIRETNSQDRYSQQGTGEDRGLQLLVRTAGGSEGACAWC